LREELLKKISDKLIEQLKPLDPELVIICGSLARGKFVENLSDVDLLIVSEKFKSMNPLKRIPFVLQYIDLNLPVDVVCYTPSEFINGLKKMMLFILDAVEYGIPIIDKKNLFKQAKRILEKLKQEHGLKPTRSGWMIKSKAVHKP